MKNDFRRLRYDEMKERNLFLGNALCGYCREPMIKTTGPIVIKSMCGITFDKCVYSGELVKRDYYECPVYLKYEKEWKKHSLSSPETER